jgi:hypothetical protein
MKFRLAVIPTLLLITLFLTACPIASPMNMKFEISPEPIVGREVNAIIQLRSVQEAPNTKLELDASEGIQFLSNKLEFELNLSEGEWVEVRVPFTVLEEGVHLISSFAFNSYEPGSENGFGAGKTLYIQAGLEEAIVSENEFSD